MSDLRELWHFVNNWQLLKTSDYEDTYWLSLTNLQTTLFWGRIEGSRYLVTIDKLCKRPRTAHRSINAEKQTKAGKIILSYINKVMDRIGRLLRRYVVKTDFRPTRSIQQHLKKKQLRMRGPIGLLVAYTVCRVRAAKCTLVRQSSERGRALLNTWGPVGSVSRRSRRLLITFWPVMTTW